MRRLTSLDFLRGLAIILMVMVHIVLATWYFVGNPDIGVLAAWQLPIAGVLILIIHWRGFFIIISSIVTYYRMAEAFKRGKSREIILRNELLYGILVLVIAKIYNTFFTTWGVFDDLTRGKSWDSSKLDFFYFVEALDVIAFGIIFVAIFFYFIHRIQRNQVQVIMYFVTGVVIFLVSPLVQDQVNTLAIWPSETHTLQNGDHFMDEVVQPVRRTILVWLGGREAPLFPMLGISFIGACIGVLITQDKPQKKHLRYANLAGLLLFVIGVIVIAVEIIAGTFVFDPGFHIHPTWFIFINTAFQGWVVIYIIRLVEFNPNLNQEKWLKYSLPVRRWGMVALTIFMYQWFDGLVRFLFDAAFDLNLAERYTVNKWWTLAMAISAVIMWQLILWIWEKFHFIGTWEHGLRYVRGVFSGRPAPLEDPLRLQDKLYDVEMISFVDNE